MHEFDDSLRTVSFLIGTLLHGVSLEVSKTFVCLTKISSFHSNEYGDCGIVGSDVTLFGMFGTCQQSCHN
jgi:hypothetical protein